MMKYFAVYDKATGEILRTGICPKRMIEAQARDGQGAIEGHADDRLHCVMDVEVEKEVKVEKSGKDGEKIIVKEMKTVIEPAIVEMTAEIRAKRDAAEAVIKKKMDRERLIRGRMNEILRAQAISELEAEGKIS